MQLKQTLRARLFSTDGIALLALTLAPFIYFFPATLGQAVFSAGDLPRFFYPIQIELARRLAEGQLPLWTPDLQGGFPLLAESQVGALYPVNWILYRVLPVPLAISYTILGHLAWAAVGMFLFARAARLSTPSALLAGIAFAFGGFFLARFQILTIIVEAAWLPWLFFLREQRERDRRGRWFVAESLAVAGVIVGGHPQIAFIILLLYTAAILCDIHFSTAPAKPRDGKIFFAARAVSLLPATCGVGIAAIQLLPLLELLSLSARQQEWSPAAFASYTLEPFRLIQLMAPFANGGPFNANIEFWGYVGFAPLLLALCAIFFQRDRRVGFLLIALLLSLVLALGDATPLHALLYNVPLANRFRAPARFLLLFAFSAAMLAAFACEQLLTRAKPQNARGETAAKIFVGTALITVILLAHQQDWDFWLTAWQYLPPALALISIGALIFSARLARGTLAAILIGATALDLAAFGAPFLSTVSALAPPATFAAAPRSLRVIEDGLPPDRSVSKANDHLSDAAALSSLQPNRALVFGAASFNIYPGLPLARYQEYFDALTPAMMNAANLRYYFVPLQAPAFPPRDSLLEPTDPVFGISAGFLASFARIVPTRVAQIEIVSYTDNTLDLPDGFLAGELLLQKPDGTTITAPLRLGIETADWAHAGFARTRAVAHRAPAAIDFPAYLSALGYEFTGSKYRARVAVAPAGATIQAIRVQSNLPANGLRIESIRLIDDAGRAQSLAVLAGKNDLELVFMSHTVAVWKNRSALPRAYVVQRAERADDAQMLARMLAPDFRPDQMVFLSDADPMPALDDASANANATIIEYKPERVVVKTKTSAPGYLVLADTWYPGWRATVNGIAAPILRANYIFRAVPLGAGESEVVFEYVPASLLWGAAISIASLAAAIWIGRRG